MNTLLKEQLNKYDLTWDFTSSVKIGSKIPYAISYLCSRFSRVYRNNSSHYNAVIDREGGQIIRLEDYGLYLKNLCLNMRLPSGYSQAVEEMLDNIAHYADNNFTLVQLDNALLNNLDELEYKDELIKYLVEGKSRIATSSDYDNLRYKQEQWQF